MHPHISTISIFDATKVEVETVKAEHGATVKITIHGDQDRTTVVNVWRDSGIHPEAPELVVKP